MMDLPRPDATIPLRQWIDSEVQRRASSQTSTLKNQSLLRTTTVAYCIVELLGLVKQNNGQPEPEHGASSNGNDASCNNDYCNSIDNFTVLLSSSNHASWNNIAGASIISHGFDVHIEEPSFLMCDTPQEDDGMGRYLEAMITTSSSSPLMPRPEGTLSNGHFNSGAKHTSSDIDDSSSSDCQQFGILLYELYSGRPPTVVENYHDNEDYCDALMDNDSGNELLDDSARKRVATETIRSDDSTQQKQSCATTLKELGLPSSINMLVQHLIDGNKFYPSLEEVRNDIHLLLEDPECYLFDNQNLLSMSSQLRIKEGKVYGRENEVSLITDAFCQVSSGNSLAMFIGGYSGCGKTMLVQSVTTRVDISGGYVLTQKVDQMSKERPLEVLSVFNTLCILIKEKNALSELNLIENRLLLDFESDFSILAQLLPNIHLLCPQLSSQKKPDVKEMRAEQVRIMNSHNVNFVLQRFMRIVSSKEKPVLLFLDDLQWAGTPALDLVYSILSDTRGSSCFFFIGSYRDNEVQDDHPVNELIANLDLACVESKHLHLSGLKNEDLNIMVSEFLGILPRMCKSLSDLVFLKTEGSPFFAIEFLMSLVDNGLLEYSLRERTWIWNEDKIRSDTCLADNVLYLLTDKMASLHENVQFALKALSCFGIKVDGSIIDYFNSTPQYADFSEWVDQAITERFILKMGREFKFQHDKVREAAYSLIPDSERSQFHHDIGLLLYSSSKNKVLDGSVMFQIADQVNYDLSLLEPMMHLDIAKLNFNAGSIALDRSDFTTAYSYLKTALSLLPEDHFRSHHELSLELYYFTARAAYSCGSIEEAKLTLQKMIGAGQCLDDVHILDAYHYLINIFDLTHKNKEAFTSCRAILSQLHEEVVDDVDKSQMANMLKETEQRIGSMSDEDWYSMKAMDGSGYNTHIIKFYSTLCNICYHYKGELMPVITCRMLSLTLEHGMSSDSLVGLIQHCATVCQISIKNVEGAYRLGNIALNIMRRFDLPDLEIKLYRNHYGFIAINVEPIQSCSQMLRKAFEVGMSTGGSDMAFHNAIFIIRFGIFSGENLPSLLRDNNYFLQLSKTFDHKLSQVYFLIYQEVISKLIDMPTDSSQNVEEPPTEETMNTSEENPKAHRVFNMILTFWQGHTKRCQYFIERLLELNFLGSYNHLFVMFYNALNSFRVLRHQKANLSKNSKVRKRSKKAYNDGMKALQSARAFSSWNYSNKIQLLKAEYNSIEGNAEAAKSAYARAISLSCSSKFIHEQGLAAECAAFHCKRIGESEDAIRYFNQAKECYMKWGSQMKVHYIDQQLETMHNGTSHCL